MIIIISPTVNFSRGNNVLLWTGNNVSLNSGQTRKKISANNPELAVGRPRE